MHEEETRPSKAKNRHPFTKSDGFAFAVVVCAVVAFGLLVGHDAKAQPTAPELRYDQIAQVRARPVAATAEEECFTQAIGATPVHVFNTDEASTDRDYARVQNVRVSNRHATQGLCLKPITFATSCAATCSGSTLTCSGAATDGDFLAAGPVPYVLPIDGTMCMCGAATGAGTTTTACRIHRDIQ